METEAGTESVYGQLEPPVATDAIDRWFELSASDDAVEPHQAVALIAARAQLERLVKQRDWRSRELAAVREAHQGACETIAQMHKAAVGETRGPIRGVVEDVEDLRARCLAAEAALSNALREQSVPIPVISDLCMHKACAEKGTYYMVGSCSNCRRGPFLLQFRRGHPHYSLTCPVCGVDRVEVERAACDNEAYPLLEITLSPVDPAAIEPING